jgi:hypothetical protein
MLHLSCLLSLHMLKSDACWPTPPANSMASFVHRRGSRVAAHSAPAPCRRLDAAIGKPSYTRPLSESVGHSLRVFPVGQNSARRGRALRLDRQAVGGHPAHCRGLQARAPKGSGNRRAAGPLGGELSGASGVRRRIKDKISGMAVHSEFAKLRCTFLYISTPESCRVERQPSEDLR